MANILDRHICEQIPENHYVIKSALNGWMVGTDFNGCIEPGARGIKYCPYCAVKLVDDNA